jgi:hypothetical protein
MTRALWSARSVGVTLAFSALFPILPSCADDPVHDAEVASLLGEVPGVPEGPYHRAGQPCTVCHGGLGPASTQFSMAGTVFEKTKLIGVDKAEILLVDANGSSPTVPIFTNCVGSFFITPDQWNPAFPVLVGIQSGNTKTEMLTQISRATSCAECHTDPQSTDGAGHVFINVSVNPNEFHACPVYPELGGDGGAL